MKTDPKLAVGDLAGGDLAPRSVDLPRALRALRSDPVISPLVKMFPPPVYRRRGTAFANLGRAIIYQQLSGKAAGTILARFQRACPGSGFPAPAVVVGLADEVFSNAGVSRQKMTYLRDLAHHFDQGHLNPRKFSRWSDDQLVSELTRVKGIGVWTVQMFQLSTLHRPDILPTGDLGIQKGLQRLYGLSHLPDPATMAKLSEAWRPWRSVACWYLWRSLD